MMELKSLLFFLSTFYLISRAKSAIIYNKELSEDEYLSRLPRPSNIWNIEDKKKSSQQKKDLLEEQQGGLSHENIIYISLSGNSEKSKEPSENKHEFSSLWNILGKTTEFLTPTIIKTFLSKSLSDGSGVDSRPEIGHQVFLPTNRPANYGPRSLSKFDPSPFYSDPVESRRFYDDEELWGWAI